MGKSGIITGENKDNAVYHDVVRLFQIYRSVSWRMQVQIGQVKHRFKKEYGTDAEISPPRGTELLGSVLHLYVGL